MKNIHAAARFLLGGWQVAPIWTAYVGAYLTSGNFNVLYTGARPDVLRNPNLSRGEWSIDGWFDTEAIRNATPGRFGNAGKGIIQGSGVNNWDVNFSKNFLFRERHRFNSAPSFSICLITRGLTIRCCSQPFAMQPGNS